MNTQLFFAALSAIFALAFCGQYTVTEEAWFEIKIKNLDGPGQDYNGRFTVALFGETAPMTVLNFMSLTRGYKKGKETLQYKGTRVHRVVPDFVVQMGDITKNDGTGGVSIYGEHFDDEEFILSHRSAGWVAMANHGSDTNASQFYILLTKARWLDGKHIVFGKVIRGFDVVETMGEVPAGPSSDAPTKRIEVVDCGLNRVDKYDLSPSQLDTTEDL